MPAPQSRTPVGPNELEQSLLGGQEGPFVGRSALRSTDPRRAFLEHFPGLDVKQWRRTVSVLASEAGIGGTTFPTSVSKTIDVVAIAQARIVTGVRLEWLQRDYNPFGAPMPVGAIGYHGELDNADACVQFVLGSNGNALVDVREQVYSYGAGGVGPAVSRTVNGWYKLHCNLLAEAGEHPEALYVGESSTIAGTWTTVSNPNFTPDFLSVTLDGWSCSNETLRRIQQAAGWSY